MSAPAAGCETAATIIQKKTGRPVQFEITEQTRASIQRWLPSVEARHGQYLFPSRFRAQPHLSTRQYARIVHSWVESAGLDSAAYGTFPHSLDPNPTFAAINGGGSPCPNCELRRLWLCNGAKW